MDLILWRHAEAFDAIEGQDDLERCLTPKGERQARRVADWLNRHLAESTRVLVSPAKRCRQTAHALGKKSRTVAELGPGASPQDLLAAARWPDSNVPVLLVGHQPTLGRLVGLLLTGEMHDLAVKKGSAWWLHDRDREGSARVVVKTVLNPEGV